jgi:AraC-like DNA-binding protein
MIIYMAQGSKKMVLDNTEWHYQAGQCIVTSIDIPTASTVLSATPENPMLCLSLTIDAALMAELLRQVELPRLTRETKVGVGVVDASEDLKKAFARLLDVCCEPEPQRDVLAGFIIKEIYYRLLLSPIGSELRQANTSGTLSHQIASAVSWLKNHFTETINMEHLADHVNMSPSSFYRNFNKMTRTTPVQYQKQLRLYEARRLLVSEKTSVENAAYRVGYKSPNQFNRDYKKMFGAPPKSDVSTMRA